MSGPERKRIPPHASIISETLRNFGYSLETALADIIDNSITAGSANINIFIDTVGNERRVGILDDGSGMTTETLHESLRWGSSNPAEERAEHDLGRFGIGLKTASFSQARRLTVVTRIDGMTSAAAWD
jgi:HSP90 family molecular chaperone